MEQVKDLKTIIAEAMELRNYDRAKLAQITGIPEHYILFIENLNTAKLPAAPYVHGYFKKIAGTLHLNFEDLWKMYEKELTQKSSGPSDKLPVNRFAIKPINKKVVLGILITIFLIIYILINARSFFGKPLLEIKNPADETAISESAIITLEGVADSRNKLTINNEEVLIDQNGKFSTTYNLQPGLNTIEFKVKKFLGRENLIIKQVLHQPKTNELLTPTTL